MPIRRHRRPVVGARVDLPAILADSNGMAEGGAVVRRARDGDIAQAAGIDVAPGRVDLLAGGDDGRLAAETDIGLNQVFGRPTVALPRRVEDVLTRASRRARGPAYALRASARSRRSLGEGGLGRDLAVIVCHRRGVTPVEPHHLHAAVVPERGGVPAAGAGQRRTCDGDGRRERPATILRARVTNHGLALALRRPDDVHGIAVANHHAGGLLSGRAGVTFDVVDACRRRKRHASIRADADIDV